MPTTLASEFTSLTDAAYRATDTGSFLAGIRDGYLLLHDRLLGPSAARKRTLRSLDEAFGDLQANPRRRRILELCAWPIFDKPALPGDDEFLWLFALPFLVKVQSSVLSAPLLLAPNRLEGADFLGMLEDRSVLADEADLRCYPTLLRREDLHSYGPQRFAQLFVQGETDQEADMRGLPLLFDEELPGHRTVCLFMPCAARLPRGKRQLFKNLSDWPGPVAAAQLHQQLLAQGVAVEAVVSLPPCSLAEVTFSCFGAGLVELEMNLLEARETYGPLEVLIKHPAAGFAEINGLDKDGQEVVVVPTFALTEPRKSLEAAVSEICEANRMGFRGSFALGAGTALLQ